jgi:DnaJ-domain-containing protein 1
MIPVTVKFGQQHEKEGEFLLAIEKLLRTSGEDFRVFKERMGDDSKLRVKMTQQERDKL